MDFAGYKIVRNPDIRPETCVCMHIVDYNIKFTSCIYSGIADKYASRPEINTYPYEHYITEHGDIWCFYYSSDPRYSMYRGFGVPKANWNLVKESSEIINLGGKDGHNCDIYDRVRSAYRNYKKQRSQSWWLLKRELPLDVVIMICEQIR